MTRLALILFTITLHAQQPARTKPAEKLAIKFGFRDWSAATVTGNTVLAGHRNQRGGLYAIDAQTGARKWWSPPKPGAYPGVIERPSVSGDIVIAPYLDYVGAVSLATGKRLWEGPAPVHNAVPVIAGDKVFYTSQDGAFYALDLATGKTVWKNAFSDRDRGCACKPIVHEGIVYTTASIREKGNHLVALDAQTGAEKWRALTNGCIEQPVLSGNIIYGNISETVFAIDRATGAFRWEPKRLLRKDERGFNMAIEIWSLTDAGSFLLAYSNAALYALDKSNAAILWNMPGEFSKNEMAVAGNVAYISGKLTSTPVPGVSGAIHAIDLDTRQVLWSYSRPQDKYSWSFANITPIDNGLWADTMEVLVKLQ